jgi:predicted Zn-dependent protease
MKWFLNFIIIENRYFGRGPSPAVPSDQFKDPKMIGRKTGLSILKKRVQDSPADQTEAILMAEDSSLTRFTPSSIHQHVAERNRTLILRVVWGKRVAGVTTNILQPSSLEATLDRAISMAKLLPPNEDFQSLPAPQFIPEIKTHFESVRRLTPQRKVKIIQEVMNLVKEQGFQASGAFSHGEVEVAILNSLGVEAYQKYSDLFFHLIVQSPESSGYSSFVSRDADQVQVEALARAALSKVSREKPIEIPPGEYEVILEPDAVQELMAFLGYLGFHALAVQEGRSFFCNRLGQKLVDEKVTIYDDGQDPRGFQVPFDFEGVPKQRVIFFEKGVAKNITYDSLTAAREKKESTGHALLPPNTEGPIPINLLMQGGESSLEDMIRSVQRGIYVSRFHYTNVVEPMKAVITGMTRDGTFMIEKGEIQRPIRNLRFTESILKALARVKAISRERKICSAGTVYGRRFITGRVAPAVHIDGFNFSGVSSL